MVPGPGVAASGFADTAFIMCTDEFRRDIQGALEHMAYIAENFTAAHYKTQHIKKIAEAEAKWGKDLNLGETFEQYKPQKFYEGMTFKSRTGKTLTGPEVYKLREVLPKVTGERNVTNALLEKIANLPKGGGAHISLKGGFNLLREVNVKSGQIDFVLTRGGKTVGWFEAGISDFNMKLTPEAMPYSISVGLDRIGPGAEMRLRGGAALMFIAEENISDRLTQAARAGYEVFSAAFEKFSANFRVFVVETFAAAKTQYAAIRGSPERAFRGRGQPFDPVADVSINVHVPPPPGSGKYADTNMFSINVYYAHPAATSLNYGLASLNKYKSPLDKISVRSWKREGVKTDEWRYAHFGQR